MFQIVFLKKLITVITSSQVFVKSQQSPNVRLLYSGGTGCGTPGEKGREAGEGRAGSGIPKVAGTWRKQIKFCNSSLYFAINTGQREENAYGKGREVEVKNTGSGSKRHGRQEVQTPLSPSTV